MSNNILGNIGKGAMITGGVIAGIGLLPITLGFGSTGIVAGSVAAGVQSMIGNVAAGSVFAGLTSLGMTGTFTTMTGVGTAIGAGGLLATIKSKFSGSNN